LDEHLVNETPYAPERSAQPTTIILRDCKSFTPQKILKHLSKEYQLTCHFIYQRALIEANLRVGAQPPHSFQNLSLVSRMVNQARKLCEHVRQVIYELFVREQRGETYARVCVDSIGPGANDGVFVFSNQRLESFGHER
jgi:hypothetical protein